MNFYDDDDIDEDDDDQKQQEYHGWLISLCIVMTLLCLILTWVDGSKYGFGFCIH